MKDLKKLQVEFRQSVCASSYGNISLTRMQSFDAFRSSPLFLEMKAALEFYEESDGGIIDGGTKAREVLSQLTESEGK